MVGLKWYSGVFIIRYYLHCFFVEFLKLWEVLPLVYHAHFAVTMVRWTLAKLSHVLDK